jgi:predicted nucleic acid-binding protein
MPAFWDASALLPVCIPGQGGPAMRRLLRENPAVVWWGTPVEVASGLARLRREGTLTAKQAQAARLRLDILRRSWREVQPTSQVREVASVQLERYDLRAGDALQLGAALVWCGGRPARRVFLCQDLRLARAARQAGFEVVER